MSKQARHKVTIYELVMRLPPGIFYPVTVGIILALHLLGSKYYERWN